jgi:hypothetical protein
LDMVVDRSERLPRRGHLGQLGRHILGVADHCGAEGGSAWVSHAGMLHLLGAGSEHSIQVGPAEAALAIRVWLATAPAPTDEQLEAFSDASVTRDS